MEFAVLEIGLKNKEMFNVFSFLRIQVEGWFKSYSLFILILTLIEFKLCLCLFIFFLTYLQHSESIGTMFALTGISLKKTIICCLMIGNKCLEKF